MNPLEKLEGFVDFYRNLYTSSNPDEIVGAQFLDGVVWAQLSEKHCRVMEAPIRTMEVLGDVVVLKPYKSPELNGLTPEFYKCKFPKFLLSVLLTKS